MTECENCAQLERQLEEANEKIEELLAAMKKAVDLLVEIKDKAQEAYDEIV